MTTKPTTLGGPSSQFLKNKREITFDHLKLYSWLHFAP